MRSNPLTLFILVIAAISLPAIALAQSKPQAPAPSGPAVPVRLDPPLFDAGRIDPEDLINANFRIINTSNTTLYIDGVTAACKCTAPVINDRVIPPGGEIEASAIVDLRGSYGKVEKNFALQFRGYARPVSCVMRATMNHAILTEPDKLRQMRGALRLTASDGRPFRPIAVLNEGAQYRFRAVQPAGGSRAVVWDVAYALPNGSTDSNLLIETDHRHAPLVTPRMFTASATGEEITYIKQRAEIYSQRTHANVGALEPGDSFDLGCQIRRPSHDEALKVYTETEGIDAQVIAVEPIPGEVDTKMYTIRVTNTGAEPGGVLTPVYLETPTPNEETGMNYRTRFWVMAIAEAPEETEDTDAPAQGEE